MPNTVVKLTNAESTWLEAAREDRKLLIKEKHLQKCRCFFHFRNATSFRWKEGDREAVEVGFGSSYPQTAIHWLLAFLRIIEMLRGEQTDLIYTISHVPLLHVRAPNGAHLSRPVGGPFSKGQRFRG